MNPLTVPQRAGYTTHMDNGSMPAWVTLAVLGLLIWRVVYAVRTARRNRRSMGFSRWTDPWAW